jgi:ElaB/YqjD/DUF883 family membrane-anchored ribosome-binding protein
MTNYDQTKDVEQTNEKGKTHPMKTQKETMADIKENVVGLARNIRNVSSDTAHDAADYLQDRMDDVKTSGSDVLVKFERRVKDKPGQSVVIAFATGLITSYLLGRRSS